MVQRVGEKIPVLMKNGRDLWWHDEMSKADPVCEPEVMESEDPLFILYTSGSTGKPKGVMHTTAGYMIYTALTHLYVCLFSTSVAADDLHCVHLGGRRIIQSKNTKYPPTF